MQLRKKPLSINVQYVTIIFKVQQCKCKYEICIYFEQNVSTLYTN